MMYFKVIEYVIFLVKYKQVQVFIKKKLKNLKIELEILLYFVIY